MASVQLLELEPFLAPFCSAPAHMQHSLVLTVHGFSSHLTPSEFEKSVADLAQQPTNKYLSLHTQLQDAFLHPYLWGWEGGMIAKSETRTRTSPASTEII